MNTEMKLRFPMTHIQESSQTKLPWEVWDNSAPSTANQDYDILPCSSQSEEVAERDFNPPYFDALQVSLQDLCFYSAVFELNWFTLTLKTNT